MLSVVFQGYVMIPGLISPLANIIKLMGWTAGGFSGVLISSVGGGLVGLCTFRKRINLYFEP
jgi:hypothetical protein